jgi:NAD(P)-dependent dehydrogenase (short-subunit alcohol dehydrogenase family)
MSTKVALVTGANKGLGLGAVRTLAKDHGFHVILASRNSTLGEASVAQLHKEGLKNVEFLQLDVSNKESIKAAAVAFKSKHQGLDLLLNNAGNLVWFVVFTLRNCHFDAKNVDYKIASDTLNTNYFGTVHVFDEFFPLVRSGGRVVNVASALGYITKFPEHLEKQFSDPNLTVVS